MGGTRMSRCGCRAPIIIYGNTAQATVPEGKKM
jgi:hypothetical protein